MSTGHNWTSGEWDEMPTVKQFIESQVDALEQELVDGISVDEIEANGITIDGKKPSLEGHEHVVSDISDFPSQIVNSVNGDSGNVTLTGADIPVDATPGAQNIDAALGDKASKSDATLTVIADSWQYTEGGVRIGLVQASEISYGWAPVSGDTPIGRTKGDIFSSELSWEADEWDGGFAFAAFRTGVKKGFVLGSQTSMAVASEEEAEGLRRGKLASTFAAPAWVSNRSYAAGALVTYDGVAYQNTSGRIIKSATTPDTSGSGWTAKPVSDLFLPLTGGTMTGPMTEKHGLVLGKEAGNNFDGFRVDANGNAEMTSHAGGSVMIGAIITATQEMPNKANRASPATEGNLAALDSSGNPTDSQIPIDTSTLQGTTGPAPSSGYGTSGGIRVKPSIMGLTDGSSLVKGDRITYLDLKTGPNGVTEITNLYAYICDNNNAQYNNVIVGKSKLFNWPGSFDTAVQVEFEGGVSIDPDVTYNILFSQTSKNIGDVVGTSECKTLRVPLVPIAQSSDYCCFNGSFSPLQGQQIEMTITYKRTMVANVPVSGAYGDAMESQWKFSPSYVQGYTITMNLMQAQDGVKATPYAAGGPASMSPITLQGDEETLTWNPMGSGISPEWYGSETLTATRIDKKQFVVGSQKDKKFQPAGVYLEANLLKGLTFDVTSNTDTQKALAAIITALGGEATNVPTT